MNIPNIPNTYWNFKGPEKSCIKETYSALVNPSDHRILFHLFALESRVSMFLKTHFGKYWSGKGGLGE